jgi:hypothetical protein
MVAAPPFSPTVAAGAVEDAKPSAPRRRRRRDEDSDSQYVVIAPPPPRAPAPLTDHQREVREAQRRGALGTYTALDPSASQDASQATFAHALPCHAPMQPQAAPAPASFAGLLAITAAQAPPSPPAAAAAAVAVPVSIEMPPPASLAGILQGQGARTPKAAPQAGSPSKRVRFAAAKARSPEAPPLWGAATQEGAQALTDISCSAAAAAAAAPLCPALLGCPGADVSLERFLGGLPKGVRQLLTTTGAATLQQLAALPCGSVGNWPRDARELLQRKLGEAAEALTPNAKADAHLHAEGAAGKGAPRRPRGSAVGVTTPAPAPTAGGGPSSWLARELARIEASPLWASLDQDAQRCAEPQEDQRGLLAAQGTLLGLTMRLNDALARRQPSGEMPQGETEHTP